MNLTLNTGASTRAFLPIDVGPVLLAIASHYYRDYPHQQSGQGTKFVVKDRLWESMPHSLTQGIVRSVRSWCGQGASHNDLLSLTPKLHKFITIYCFDADDNLREQARLFLKIHVVKGLQSMQRVYKDIAMAGQIETWINSIDRMEHYNPDQLPTLLGKSYSAKKKKIMSVELITKYNRIFAQSEIFDPKNIIKQTESEGEKLAKRYKNYHQSKESHAKMVNLLPHSPSIPIPTNSKAGSNKTSTESTPSSSVSTSTTPLKDKLIKQEEAAKIEEKEVKEEGEAKIEEKEVKEEGEAKIEEEKDLVDSSLED